MKTYFVAQELRVGHLDDPRSIVLNQRFAVLDIADIAARYSVTPEEMLDNVWAGGGGLITEEQFRETGITPEEAVTFAVPGRLMSAPSEFLDKMKKAYKFVHDNVLGAKAKQEAKADPPPAVQPVQPVFIPVPLAAAMVMPVNALRETPDIPIVTVQVANDNPDI